MKQGTGQKIFVAKDALRFSPGEEVLILRSNLWSGCVGTVVSEKDGVHLIRIKAKPDGSNMSEFSASVPGQELEAYL